MKNLILLTAFTIVTLSHGLFAQSIGIKAGLNLSKWQGDDVDRAQNKPGLHLGLFYEFPLGEKSVLQPGIMYAQKGVRNKESEILEFNPDTEIKMTGHLDFRANYLEIPISYKYLIDEKVYFLAIPTASFLLKNKTTFTITQCIDGTCTGSREEGEIDEMRNIDVNLNLGVGFNITKKVGLEGSYQFGLLSFDEDGESAAYNRTFMFSIGYRF